MNVIFIFLLYFFSYIPIVFNSGIYWDDWTLFNTNIELVSRDFKEDGIPWFSVIHRILLPIQNNINIYRFITFFSFLFPAFFLYDLLRSIKEIDQKSRLLIVVFFAIFPVNFARIALIDIVYSGCYFSFYFGLWLTYKSIQRKILLFKLLSYCFFFLSFLTASFIFFYPVALLYILYSEKINLTNFVEIKKTIYKNIYYLVLPIVFILIKSVFFSPYGDSAGYNLVTFQGLLLSVPKLFRAFNHSFFDVINAAFLATPFLVLLLFIPLIAYCLKMIWQKNESMMAKISLRSVKYWLFFGIFAYLIGVFPYIVVGGDPAIRDWQNRHQLLVPLGASFMLVFGFKIITNRLRIGKMIEIFCYSCLITVFVSGNFISYVKYKIDWYKQLALIAEFKKSQIVRNNRTFIFIDQAPELNAFDRKYRFYEYSGIFKYSFNDQTRIGVDINDYDQLIKYKKSFRELYSLKDYRLSNKNRYLAFIKRNSSQNFIHLIFEEYFAKQKFVEDINHLLKLSFIKMEDD
jgi:hypothetical protein